MIYSVLVLTVLSIMKLYRVSFVNQTLITDNGKEGMVGGIEIFKWPKLLFKLGFYQSWCFPGIGFRSSAF